MRRRPSQRLLAQAAGAAAARRLTLVAQPSRRHALGCEDAVSEVRRRVGDEAWHVRVEVWASSSGAAALDRTPARGSTSAAKLAHPSGSLLMTSVEGGIAEEGELRAMGCTLRGA